MDETRYFSDKALSMEESWLIIRHGEKKVAPKDRVGDFERPVGLVDVEADDDEAPALARG